MSEIAKTSIFLVVAALALAAAWLTRPAPFDDQPELAIGQPLFPEFTDPVKAESLEIIKYNEDQGTLEPFTVAKVDGVWAIESHQNYPADATDHLKVAATSLIGVNALDVVSDNASEHELYGVVDPEPGKLTLGSEGVGTRVTFKDEKGGALANLIVGNEDPDRANVRYVRKPGQDRVYKAEVDTSKLTTQFADWIEDDLLKLSAFDVKEIVINDYSLDEVENVIVQRGRFVLAYDNQDAKWQLVEMQELGPDQTLVSAQLADGEELVAETLNDLKFALDDLKIVDVVRKPAGLSDTLRTDEQLLSSDASAVQQLKRRGFHLARLGDAEPEIYSNEGEVRCGLSTGVEYVLRFGRIASLGEAGQTPADADPAAAAADATGAEGEGETSDGGESVNRYIMVTARFNQDLIPRPELAPLPDAPDADSAEGEQPADTAANATAAGDAPAATEPAAAQPAADAATEPAAAEPAADAPTEPAVAEEGDKPAEGVDAPADADEPSDEKSADAVAAERAQIEIENQRKQQEYEDKVKQGQEKVQELNDRFADWYYVIADSTYKKVHLGRGELIKQKETPPGEGDAPQDLDALRTLPEVN